MHGFALLLGFFLVFIFFPDLFDSEVYVHVLRTWIAVKKCVGLDNTGAVLWQTGLPVDKAGEGAGGIIFIRSRTTTNSKPIFQ